MIDPTLSPDNLWTHFRYYK